MINKWDKVFKRVDQVNLWKTAFEKFEELWSAPNDILNLSSYSFAERLIGFSMNLHLRIKFN